MIMFDRMEGKKWSGRIMYYNYAILECRPSDTKELSFSKGSRKIEQNRSHDNCGKSGWI